ncbi:MAG: sugar ABC transporter ATP-binding protein [Deltaproteobacteria bacterium]|nr:sugar ABC transporter ATP-binding protein [Deltaproteobacteria bacterium]
MGTAQNDNVDVVIKASLISKYFPGVVALDNVDFEVRRGESHALVGENGAGKSTLMKILYREYSEDTGRLYIDGKNAKDMDIRQIRELGLSLIHQDLNLVPIFTVAHNICMGVEPVNRLGFIDRKELKQKAAPFLQEISSDIDIDARVQDLSISQQQLVTVARALVAQPKFLILDEPTARLDQKSTEALFDFLDRCKQSGITIIYISHRLEEIYRICDRITVLRDGKKILTAAVEELTQAELVKHMVGRELKKQVPKEEASIGEVLLSVRDLHPMLKAEAISFDLRFGEILGIVGSIGAGKSEVARAIFGADRKRSGTIRLKGEKLRIRNPRGAINAGIALVPEERRQQGLVITESIRKNMTLAALKKKFCAGGFWIKQREEKEAVKKSIKDFKMATPSLEQEARLLSGGTQQKVVIGKWLLSESSIYIFDEPTKGIDVGGKHDIYKMIVDLATNGAGVIFISNELDEVLALCDRILVMFRGQLVKELVNKEVSKDELLYYVMGGKDNESKNK